MLPSTTFEEGPSRGRRPAIDLGLTPADGGPRIERAPGSSDPTTLEGTGFQVRYRAVEFSVPEHWYQAWILEWGLLAGSNDGNDLVSNVDTVLAAVWPEYTAALASQSDLDDDSVDSVLGCYSLQSTADRALFWRKGWGPAREVFRLMSRLAVIYSDDVRDDWMDPTELPGPGGSSLDFSWCQGMGDFCRTVLKGGRAPSRIDTANCRIQLNFDDIDLRFWGIYGHSACGSSLGRPCGIAFNLSDPGTRVLPFDGELDDWEDSGWSDEYRAWTRAPGYEPALKRPSGDYSLLGIGGGHKLTLHAIHLQWCAFVTDRVLYLARMAHDYARYLDAQEGGCSVDSAAYDQAALQLGRYAFGPALDLGRAMIHELGHSYMGSHGHCEFQCCFDSAARAWQVRVQARLGVPWRLWSSGALFTPGDVDRAQADDFGGTHTPHEFTGYNGGACGTTIVPTSGLGITTEDTSGRYDADVEFYSGTPGVTPGICFHDGRVQSDVSGYVVSRWQTQPCGRVLEES